MIFRTEIQILLGYIYCINDLYLGISTNIYTKINFRSVPKKVLPENLYPKKCIHRCIKKNYVIQTNTTISRYTLKI